MRISKQDITDSWVSGLEATTEHEAKRVAMFLAVHSENRSYDRMTTVSPGFLMFITNLRALGHTVDFYYFRDEMLGQLCANRYDVVGLSGTELDMLYLLECAVDVKRVDPTVVTAIGGFATQSYAQQLLLHPAVDVTFCGEADYTFPLFLKNLTRIENPHMLKRKITKQVHGHKSNTAGFRKLWGNYQYLSPISEAVAEQIFSSYFVRHIRTLDGKHKAKVPINMVYAKTFESTAFHRDEDRDYAHMAVPISHELNALMQVDFAEVQKHRGWDPTEIMSSFPFGGKQYRQLAVNAHRQISWRKLGIYAQRGCPWQKCTICGIDYVHRRPSVEPLPNLAANAAEIRNTIDDRQIWDLSFNDDNFVSNRDWVLQLVNQLMQRGLHKRMCYGAQTRVMDFWHENLPDEELISALGDCHFGIGLGLETLVPRKAEILGKYLNGEAYVQRAEAILEECARKGLNVVVNLIMAVPDTSLLELSEELSTTSSLLLRLYQQYGHLVHVSINDRTIPHSTNRLTLDRTGDIYHGIHEVDSQQTEEILYNGVIHRTIPIAMQKRDGRLITAHIVIPRSFVIDPDVERVFDIKDRELPKEPEEEISSFLFGEQFIIRHYHIEYLGYLARAVLELVKTYEGHIDHKIMENAQAARDNTSKLARLASEGQWKLWCEADARMESMIYIPAADGNLPDFFRSDSNVEDVLAVWMDYRYRLKQYKGVFSAQSKFSPEQEVLRHIKMLAAAHEVSSLTQGQVMVGDRTVQCTYSTAKI